MRTELEKVLGIRGLGSDTCSTKRCLTVLTDRQIATTGKCALHAPVIIRVSGEQGNPEWEHTLPSTTAARRWIYAHGCMGIDYMATIDGVPVLYADAWQSLGHWGHNIHIETAGKE